MTQGVDSEFDNNLFSIPPQFPINSHYVDNNSTPTMISNLLEAKHNLF